MDPQLDRLLARQAGVATLPQLLAAGMTAHEVLAHVDARRWTRWGDRCVLAHNATPARLSMMWIAVLDNRGPAALAGFSALEVRSFRYVGAEVATIHVVVVRGAAYHRFPGVQVHESRRFRAADVLTAGEVVGAPQPPPGTRRAAAPPRLAAARSAVDAGAWQPHARYACGVLAAAVQQRVCGADQLEAALASVGRVRHRAAMRLAVRDIAGGAEALGELDLAALCRRFDLQPPHRQSIRRDRDGRRRYLDCEWRLPEGSVIVLEVDGSHHLSVEQWESDMRRERGVVISGRTVLRASVNQVRHEGADLAADLAAAGVPRT